MEKPVTKEIKCYARCVLSGQHGRLAGITALLTVLNLALTILATEAAPGGSSILSVILYFGCSILVNIVYYILLAGLYRIYLNICSNRPYKWKDLFSAFTEHPEPVAIYSVLQYVLTYTMTALGIWWLNGALQWYFYIEEVNILLRTAILLIALVLYVFIKISLSMVLFVHADSPYKSFREMMEEGWKLMDGMRLRFFTMWLSFIGMYFLCILSFGIGFLFVDPYLYTTEGYFYKKISGR